MFTVQSPAGETVTIYTDQEFMELTKQTRDSLKWLTAREPLLINLWTMGAVADSAGFASRKLLERIPNNRQSMMALRSMLHGNPLGDMISQTITGKRCYRIALHSLPESWHSKLAGVAWVDGNKISLPEPAPEAHQLAQILDAALAPSNGLQEPAEDPAPPTDVPTLHVAPADTGEPESAAEQIPYLMPDPSVIEAVAMSLLGSVVDLIRSGPSTNEVDRIRKERDEARAQLHQRTEQLEASRREVKRAGDLLHALTVERNGLLQRQRALEENLQKALKATPRDAVESLVNDRIAAFMQERPKEHE